MVAETKNHVYYMQEALKEASKSGSDVPIGCVIVVGDKIIGRGYNQREANKDISAHAEIIAIKEAEKHLGNWRVEEAVLYSTLEPCPMCAEAIIQARLQTVVFGAYDSVNGAAGSFINLFDAQRKCYIPEIAGGIEEDKCKSILQDFFAKRRK